QEFNNQNRQSVSIYECDFSSVEMTNNTLNYYVIAKIVLNFRKHNSIEISSEIRKKSANINKLLNE
ncbi:hypothetical protein AB9T88_15440, partial [Flavobacterium sp. LBUM151]